MPICIAGMHRSGTSMFTSLLQQCGLYIGTDADIVPATSSNSEGHWENVRFVAINEALLGLSGSAWNRVGTLDNNWDLAATYDPLREQARQLVKSFDGREPWGWKDPRNSLTLPFWVRLLSNLKVIICVRHPLEVAYSLQSRDGMSVSEGLQLWFDYYARLRREVAPECRLVTHYQCSLLNTREELTRVLRFADMCVGDDTLASALRLPRDTLRHNCVPFAALLELPIPLHVVREYVAWCAEAGPNCHQYLSADLASLTTPWSDRGEASGLLGALTVRLIEQGRRVAELEQRMTLKPHRWANRAVRAYERGRNWWQSYRSTAAW